jgi:hypothetical protein
MENTEDPALEAFRNRRSQEPLDLLMQRTARQLGGES